MSVLAIARAAHGLVAGDVAEGAPLGLRKGADAGKATPIASGRKDDSSGLTQINLDVRVAPYHPPHLAPIEDE